MNSPFHFNSFHSFTADFTHHDAVPHDPPLTELHFLSARKSKDVDKRWILLAPEKQVQWKTHWLEQYLILNCDRGLLYLDVWCPVPCSNHCQTRLILLLKEKYFLWWFWFLLFFFKHKSLLLFLDIAEVSEMWKKGQQWIFLEANKNLQSEMAGYCSTTIELYFLREKVN